MNIYLIGMPCSGKSTLGIKLAKKLNYEFIDMDSYIEKKACMFIDEMFELYGEKYFRDLETSVLEELSKKDNLVISTGGGIIKNKNHKDIMKNGKCVYLYVPVEILQERLENSYERPLLKTKPVIALYNERKELYECFMDIKVENLDIDKSIEEIMERIK